MKWMWLIYKLICNAISFTKAVLYYKKVRTLQLEAVWPEKRSYVYKCISINIHKVYHVKIVYHNQLLLVCVQRYIQIEFSPNCSYN